MRVTCGPGHTRKVAEQSGFIAYAITTAKLSPRLTIFETDQMNENTLKHELSEEKEKIVATSGVTTTVKTRKGKKENQDEYG